MKVPIIKAYILVVFLVAIVRADVEDTASQPTADEVIQEIQTKEESVRAAKAKFDEAQELFDAAAAELQEVIDKLQQVSAEVQTSQHRFTDVLNLTSKFTDQITLLTLNLVNDAKLWNFQQRLNDSVIGVALEEASDIGVLIKGVLDTAPADKAGIEAGDIILRVDDIDITGHDNPSESAIELINSRQPGTVIQLAIQRNDDELAVDVATIARSSMNKIRASGGEWHALEGVTIENTPMDPSLWNIVTTTLPGAENKVYVVEIEEDLGSYFDVDYGILVVKAPDVDSIQAGDILLKIDDKPIRSISQAFQHKHDAEDDVELRIKRKKKEENISLDKDQFSLQAILE